MAKAPKKAQGDKATQSQDPPPKGGEAISTAPVQIATAPPAPGKKKKAAAPTSGGQHIQRRMKLSELSQVELRKTLEFATRQRDNAKNPAYVRLQAGSLVERICAQIDANAKELAKAEAQAAAEKAKLMLSPTGGTAGPATTTVSVTEEPDETGGAAVSINIRRREPPRRG